MRIFINEQLHELKDKSSLAEAIDHLDIPRQGLAVAVNAGRASGSSKSSPKLDQAIDPEKLRG